MKNIEFNCVEIYNGAIPKPLPASKFIPDWYKKMKKDHEEPRVDYNTGKLIQKQTMRRCFPIQDYLLSGYILPLYTDLHVEKYEEDKTYYTFHSALDYGVIEYHDLGQYAGSNISDKQVYKLVNPWDIKTPKGYSCLFYSPYWCDTKGIQAVPAIVDTDSYHNVNIPFTFSPPDGIKKIPINTPVVQILPFKREEWKMETGITSLAEDARSRNIIKSMLHGAYNKLYRSKKIFR